MTATLDAAELFRRLSSAGVDCVVIGGFAVVAHGVIRATKDLDICPSPARENLARLAALLKDLRARQVGHDEFADNEFPLDPTDPDDLAVGGNFLVETNIGRLDVMQWVRGVDADDAYGQLAATAVTAEAFGVPITVASLADLRRMKRAAGRPRDLQDLQDLAVAHGDEEDHPR